MAPHCHSQIDPRLDRDALTCAYLHEAFSYNPSTGEFVGKTRPRAHFISDRAAKSWNARFSGKKVGRLTDRGYVNVGVCGHDYRAHRLAWLYMTGEWPRYEVDHRDGNRANNRWTNLRDIPGAGNRQNTKRQTNNTSGFTGVVWDRCSHRWRARIKLENKWHYLGVYQNKIDAHRAYLAAKKKFHSFQPVPREMEIRA